MAPGLQMGGIGCCACLYLGLLTFDGALSYIAVFLLVLLWLGLMLQATLRKKQKMQGES
jgi:hypothetical protein